MSIWNENDLDEKVLEILRDAASESQQAHMGIPFVTAYQLAIGLSERYPETVAAIGKPVGGSGTGGKNSLAQYLANELSKQIKARGKMHPVEGAFLSTRYVKTMTYQRVDGSDLVSSLTGTGFPLSMFRIRNS